LFCQCCGICTDLVLADPIHIARWLGVDGTTCQSRRFVLLKITFTCDSWSTTNVFCNVWARSRLAHSESPRITRFTTPPASVQRSPLSTQQTSKCSSLTRSVSATAAFAFSNAAFSDATSPAFPATTYAISSGPTTTTISCSSCFEYLPRRRTCKPQHTACCPTWTTTAYRTSSRDTLADTFSRSEWQLHPVAYTTSCYPRQRAHERRAESSRLWSAITSSTAVCSWSS
jgi:hypothetical protein